MSLNLKTYTEHFTNPLYLESGRILKLEYFKFKATQNNILSYLIL